MGGAFSQIDQSPNVKPSTVAAGGKAVDKSDEALAAQFDAVDVDKSGQIDRKELTKAITKVYGKGLDPQVITDMLKAGDTDGDGEVDLEEFMAIMRSGPDVMSSSLNRASQGLVNTNNKAAAAKEAERQAREGAANAEKEARRADNLRRKNMKFFLEQPPTPHKGPNGSEDVTVWLAKASGRVSPSPTKKAKAVEKPGLCESLVKCIGQ